MKKPAPAPPSPEAQPDYAPPALGVELPEDTSLIPRPAFWLRAWRRRLPVAAMTVLAALWAGMMAALMGYASLAPLLAVAAWGLLVLLIASTSTRPAFVIRKDARGVVEIDEQAWWKDEVLKWPDALKIPSRRGPVLWLDATDGVRPFVPEAAPRPVPGTDKANPDWQPSSADFAAIPQVCKMYRAKFQWSESGNAEAIKLGMMVAVILGCLFATYLAGDRAVKVLTGQEGAGAAATRTR